MKFDKNPPTDKHKHGLVFESEHDEVEAVAAAYREVVNQKAKSGKISDIKKHERDFSQWGNFPDQTILTNHPLQIALLLEGFYGRTAEAVREIVASCFEPAFDSDAIARRIDLGEKAFQLAGLIKLEYDNDTLDQMLDDHGVSLFATPAEAPEQPFD